MTADPVTTDSVVTMANAKGRPYKQDDCDLSEQQKLASQVPNPLPAPPSLAMGVLGLAAAVGGAPADTAQPLPFKSVSERRVSVPLMLYRRPLPESCTAFASKEGKQIFMEALKTGTVFLFSKSFYF